MDTHSTLEEVRTLAAVIAMTGVSVIVLEVMARVSPGRLEIL